VDGAVVATQHDLRRAGHIHLAEMQKKFPALDLVLIESGSTSVPGKRHTATAGRIMAPACTPQPFCGSARV
jgi:hypothetical protein